MIALRQIKIGMFLRRPESQHVAGYRYPVAWAVGDLNFAKDAAMVRANERGLFGLIHCGGCARRRAQRPWHAFAYAPHDIHRGCGMT
jgi:hypothetical protein